MSKGGGAAAAEGAGAGAFGRATGRGFDDETEHHQQRYRAYQRELIRPHCGPSVLEVGAGLGGFASQIEGLDRHVVTDVDPGCVAHMARRFADRAEVEARQLDLVDPGDGIGAPVATVVAINVLEHFADDRGTLRTLARQVEPGGTVVIWVPGYMQLYGEFDRRVGHVRRYTPTTLRAAMVGADLDPVDVRPVNLLGGMAWWLAVRAGGVGGGGAGGGEGEGESEDEGEGEGTGEPGPTRTRLVRAYDRVLVPVTRAVERRVTPPFGQSVLGVANVPD